MAEEHEIIRWEKVKNFFLEGIKEEDNNIQTWVDEFVKAQINENYAYDVEQAKSIFENKNYFSYNEAN